MEMSSYHSYLQRCALTCETIHKFYSEHSMFFNAIFTKTGTYSAHSTVDNIMKSAYKLNYM